MRFKAQAALGAGIALLTAGVSAQEDVWPLELVGTWSTKSNQTLTGPGFYDPVKDQFIEPSRTGISYSFTADGYYEEAFYRAISNPTNPQCPSAILQWQHGQWTLNTNGSLTLTPIAVDGRQLMSTPCNYKNGIYTRYNQTELYKTYQVYLDSYHQISRLDLFQFDGTPVNAMYLAYKTPLMLPTTTLSPTSTTSSGAKSTSKVKRNLERKASNKKRAGGQGATMAQKALDPNWWWWTGMTFTGVGGLLYFGPRRTSM